MRCSTRTMASSSSSTSTRRQPAGRTSCRPAPATRPIDEASDHRGGKGHGRQWLRHVDRTYDVTRMQDTLREALTTEEKGPKVIVASSECMLNRQRRETGGRTRPIKGGTASSSRSSAWTRHLHRRPGLHAAVQLPATLGEVVRRSAARRSAGEHRESCVGGGIAARLTMRRCVALPSTVLSRARSEPLDRLLDLHSPHHHRPVPTSGESRRLTFADAHAVA